VLAGRQYAAQEGVAAAGPVIRDRNVGKVVNIPWAWKTSMLAAISVMATITGSKLSGSSPDSWLLRPYRAVSQF
jgi:hypothetical protein